MTFDENPVEKNEPEFTNPQEGKFVDVGPIPAAPGAPVSNVSDSTPLYGEPVNHGEVPHFDSPASGEPPKKNNKKIWIIIAVVLVLLCCCCIVLAVVLSQSTEIFEEMYYEFSVLPQFLAGFSTL
jgi:hypothetical protein